MGTLGLYCTRCGHLNEEDAAFCAKCGAPQQLTPTVANVGPYADHYGAPPVIAGQYAVTPYAPPVRYAGFWARFLAYVIDSIVISCLAVPLIAILVGMGALGSLSSVRSDSEPNLAIIAMFPAFFGIFVAGGWLYHALMESSGRQGTVGKIALGLKVTDLHGNRLSFGHATGRYFAKLINSFTFTIGWIMAGFTEKKQALHDIIAGTLVLKTSA